MSDIVERLREVISPTYADDAREAADRIEQLETALKGVIDDIHEHERINNLAHIPPRMVWWDSVARASRVLEGKE